MFRSIKPLVTERSTIIGTGVIAAAFLIGVIFDMYILDESRLSPGLSKSNCLSNLAFINPEPDCDVFENKLNKINILQDNLEREVKAYLKTGRADKVSVFVRDLSSRRFAEVNGSEPFFMASLLKVPLSIAYFRLAEITPDLLSQEITYTDSYSSYPVQAVESPEKLVRGKSYSVADLLYRIIAYSDNGANEMLSKDFVSSDYLRKVLVNIGLQPDSNADGEFVVTARSYAGVFRILYNSSFLSRKYSNEILRILSESTFIEGATAKLPQGVRVAHKFGERSLVDSMTKEVVMRQLHDCGIVYASGGDEPYTFCIMTEGKDLANLKSIIQNISATIYEEIQE